MHNILIFKNSVKLNERCGALDKYHFVYLRDASDASLEKVINAIKDKIMSSTTGDSLTRPELLHKYHLFFANSVFKAFKSIYSYFKVVDLIYGEVLLECSSDVYNTFQPLFKEMEFGANVCERFDVISINNRIFSRATYNTFRIIEAIELYVNEDKKWCGVQNLHKLILSPSEDVLIKYCNNPRLLDKDLSEVKKHPLNCNSNIYSLNY